MGCGKIVLRGNFVMINAYTKKDIGSYINNVIVHLQELENKEQSKPKVSQRKAIKIRAEINRKHNKTGSWFFENINDIDKFLARLAKKKKTLIKIRNKRGDIITTSSEIKRIMRVLRIILHQQTR